MVKELDHYIVYFPPVWTKRSLSHKRQFIGNAIPRSGHRRRLIVQRDPAEVKGHEHTRYRMAAAPG